MTLIISVCGIFGFSVIIATAPLILEKWSHETIKMERWEIVTIGIHSLLSLLWFVPATLRFAQNKHAIIIKPLLFSTCSALFIWLFIKNQINPILGASLLLAAPEAAVLAVLIFSFKSKKIQKLS